MVQSRDCEGYDIKKEGKKIKKYLESWDAGDVFKMFYFKSAQRRCQVINSRMSI